MPGKATTVKDYLDSLPRDRRSDIMKVRNVIVDNLPIGYQEAASMRMLTYSVPLSVCPDTYNGEPLCYAALASQKNYMAVYLMGVYGSKDTETWFRSSFKERGKKLDMGKSCVRFKTVEDLPLDVIGQAIARHSVEEWVSLYRLSRTKARTSRQTRVSRGTRAGATRAPR
jgi:Domain of unknown function (DU1801)